MLTARNTTQNTTPVQLPASFAEFGFYDLAGILETMNPQPGDRIEIDGEPFYFVAVPYRGRLCLAKFRIDGDAYSAELCAAIIRARNENQR